MSKGSPLDLRQSALAERISPELTSNVLVCVLVKERLMMSQGDEVCSVQCALLEFGGSYRQLQPGGSGY